MTHVMFIDANRNVREFCRRELERDGYRVTLARSPLEAAEWVCDVRPDVVVIDLDLCDDEADRLGALLATMGIPVVLHGDAYVELEQHSRRGDVVCVEKSGDLASLAGAIDGLAQRSRNGDQRVRRRTTGSAPVRQR